MTKNQSIAQKKNWENPNYRKKMSAKHKGQHNSPATEFKKGNPSFWKGKKRKNISGENNPLWKGGINRSYSYKIAFENLPIKCNRCGLSDIDKLQVHHKDKNPRNNKLENLEILCTLCHTHHHKNWEKRWKKE